MKGLDTGKTRIRQQVFTEIARLAYEGGEFRPLIAAAATPQPAITPHSRCFDIRG